MVYFLKRLLITCDLAKVQISPPLVKCAAMFAHKGEALKLYPRLLKHLPHGFHEINESKTRSKVIV